MAFRYQRRVQFAETDLAGIAHFAVLFRYMEEAEHALWRAAGLSIAKSGENVGWPRVSASLDFTAPLRFEDECEVVVTIEKISRSSISYRHVIVHGETVIAEGTMTAVHVDKKPGEKLTSAPIPKDIVDRLRAAVR
ncbi:MAG: thioesterase family protein [Vicinamibacterales bacterium]